MCVVVDAVGNVDGIWRRAVVDDGVNGDGIWCRMYLCVCVCMLIPRRT